MTNIGAINSRHTKTYGVTKSWIAMKICDTLLPNGMRPCHHHMENWVIINHKGQQYFQLTNIWNWFIKSMTWIIMLTNKTPSPCWHITCHVVIMGNWVVINHKGGWFLQLTNYNCKIMISHDISMAFTTT